MTKEQLKLIIALEYLAAALSGVVCTKDFSMDHPARDSTSQAIHEIADLKDWFDEGRDLGPGDPEICPTCGEPKHPLHL